MGVVIFDLILAELLLLVNILVFLLFAHIKKAALMRLLLQFFVLQKWALLFLFPVFRAVKIVHAKKQRY